MEKGIVLKVTDGNDAANTAEYILDKETEEYVFIVNTETEEKRTVKVMVRDYKNLPVKCERITFKQEDTGKELATKLDEHGDTYFAKDALETGKPVTACIEGGTKKYITFTLEEDEDEYLLKENAPKSKWWMILAEILIVAATAAAMWLVWPAFEDIAREIFYGIYN